MQAVILAAGKGLRLRPFTEKHPKPLIDIADKPLLEYTLSSLPESITEIIIVVGYLGEQIREAFGDSWKGKPIKYVEQPILKGTGDALYCAKDLLQNKFLVVNGDDLYSQEDLTELTKHDYSILAWESKKAYAFGLAESADGHLTGFDSNSPLTNSGAYFLDRTFFDGPLATVLVHEATEYSLPHTLVELATKQPICIVKAHFWLPVGTPEQLQLANEIISAQ